MRWIVKAAVVGVVCAAVAGAIVAKRATTRPSVEETPPAAHADQGGSEAAAPGARVGTGAEPSLPRLVDLGRGTCIPCKMMAPILEALQRDYAGRLTVEVIDISDHPDAVDKYGVQIIPTQVFYSALGDELFRHEGFMSRDEILDKWRELGHDLASPSPAPTEG